MAKKEVWEDWVRNRGGRYIALTSKEESEWDDKSFLEEGERDIRELVIPFLQKKGMDSSKLSALDIGCGPGRLTRALGMIFAKATGIDISREMISQAKELVDGGEFYAAEATDMPFKDSTFDFIFSFLVFQHMGSKRYVWDTFKEIYRVMKPGAHALIQFRTVPGRSQRADVWWKSFNRFWFGIGKWHGLYVPVIGYAGFFNSHYGPVFKPEELIRELSKQGYKNVRVEKIVPGGRLGWDCMWAEMQK